MKRRFSATLAVGILLPWCGLAFGQDQHLIFDVASVRPAAPPTGIAALIFQQRGGPGSADPERIAYTNIPMRQLLMFAHGLTQPYQLEAPKSADDDKYDIEAKIPAGATREQFNVMLQNLLMERFHLQVRHDTRTETTYELVIAKGGVKMKEAVQTPGLDPEPPGRGGRGGVSMSKDKDGLPELAPGRSTRAIIPLPNGSTRISGRMQSIQDILAMCLNQAGKPVVDKTGLSGKYDFNLDFKREGAMTFGVATGGTAAAPAGDASDPAPDFVTAIQQQLGLKLAEKKGPVDVLVVEHVEKVPTAN
jgi:uncharacterized protein (TIGR03435 family)